MKNMLAIGSVEMLNEKHRCRPIRLLASSESIRFLGSRRSKASAGYRSARGIVNTQCLSHRCFYLGFLQSLAVLLLLPVAYAANLSTTVIDEGLLNVQLAKYEPSPAEAGKIFTVWIKAENRGIQVVGNASFILISQYPFTLPNNDPVRIYGSITGLDDIQLEYKLLADEKALNGTYRFKLKYAPDGRIFAEKEFSVTVREQAKKEKADLDALLVSVKPAAYTLGRSNLTVDVANRDKGTASFTIVKAESDAAYIETNEIFVGNLKSDDFETVTFELEFRNLTGRYPVNMKMIYKDSDSNTIEENDTVYITIAEKPYMPKETPLWIYAVYIASAAIVLRLIFVPSARYVRKFLPPRKK